MAVKSVRVKISSAAARALLSSARVAADLEARATRIAATANASTSDDGFTVDVTKNRDRAIAFVRTGTHAAREAEAESRALTRAINAGR